MLDGIKILIERLNAYEGGDDIEQFGYLAQEVVRNYGDDVDPFTDEEKAIVREALINYQRKQFTARVLSRVSGEPEQTAWFNETVAKAEQYQPVTVGKNLIISNSQMERLYRVKTKMGLR